METLISRDKLSKKGRRELDSRAWATWQRSPVIRCPAPTGTYDRSRQKALLRREGL